MTTAAPQTTPEKEPAKKTGPNGEFDPDHFRMTIGEHLEELRSRLIKGLIGFGLALVVCLIFAERIISLFCLPLINVLKKNGVNPQLVIDSATEGFTVFMKISAITAAAFAAPWMLYQLWQFVAAGLFPHERKYVTKYLPLSLTLLVTGMVFVYFIVLPWTLDFLIKFSIGIPLPIDPSPTVDISKYVPPTPPGGTTQPTGISLLNVRSIPGNPDPVRDGDVWYDSSQQRLKIFINGQVKVVSWGSDELIRPELTLDEYINLVLAMLISFGLAFQLPLVVLAIERIGIIDVPGLKRIRKYVYFAMVVVAAVITPGDAITATVAMVGPLIGLYEFGIWLAKFGRKPEPAEPAAT